MTCIAAVIDKHGVGHIASDSIGASGQDKNLYKNHKVFKKGDFLFGYTSSFRMGQLLEHGLQMPDRKPNQLLDDYIYNDFIEAVRKLLKQNGYARVDNNQEWIGTFLIVAEGRIFKVQDDLAVLEPENNFATCGSGEDYAQAVLDILTNNKVYDGKDVLTVAIETASKYVTSVGGKVQYLHS